MNIAIRKYYYGDIPEDGGGSNELKDSSKASPPAGEEVWRGLPNGHYGKYSSAVNRVLIINMPAACMPPMRKWPLKTQEMYIPVEWKELASGRWKVNTFMPAVLMRQSNCMNLLMIKFIVIRHFMICRMK